MESKDGALAVSRQWVSAQRSPHRTSGFHHIRRSNQPCLFILARFHDVPLGGTLCRALVLVFFGLCLRPLWQALSFWISSGFYGGPALLGFYRIVDRFLHFWSRPTVV